MTIQPRPQSVRILIIGGLGFIGSRLARALAAAPAHDVLAIDDRSGNYVAAEYEQRAQKLSDAGVELLALDVIDAAALSAHLEDFRPDLVYHFAARPNVLASVSDPELSMRVNCGGIASLLAALDQSGTPERLIVASSSSVCAGDDVLPAPELRPQECLPISPYGESKLASERLVHEWHRRTGVQSILARLFNVYGPDGRRDLLPMIVACAIVEGSPVALRGWRECRRDWTYIDDVIENLTALGRCDRLKPVEAEVTWADTTRLRELLDDQPSTPLAEGINRFWNWFTESENGLAPRAMPASTPAS